MKCPYCGNTLRIGTLPALPKRKNIWADSWKWLSDDTQMKKVSFLDKIFEKRYDKIIYLSDYDYCRITANYCDRCDIIFAEFQPSNVAENGRHK